MSVKIATQEWVKSLFKKVIEKKAIKSQSVIIASSAESTVSTSYSDVVNNITEAFRTVYNTVGNINNIDATIIELNDNRLKLDYLYHTDEYSRDDFSWRFSNIDARNVGSTSSPNIYESIDSYEYDTSTQTFNYTSYSRSATASSTSTTSLSFTTPIGGVAVNGLHNIKRVIVIGYIG